MRHYVAGKLEAEGPLKFLPLGPGCTSIGVRLNEVHWFKGCIAELRYDARAPPAGELQAAVDAAPPTIP